MNNRRGLAFAVSALCLAALAAPPASALHRCTGKDGKVTYTEFDCEKDANQSGVAIYDSSGMDINKRTNSFGYTPPPPARSTSRTTATTTTTRTPVNETPRPGDKVVRKNGQYEPVDGDALKRPPIVKFVKKEDKEREQENLNRDWDAYNKQQSDLKQQYMNQPKR